MSNYRLVITKVEPNPEYAKMIEESEKVGRGRYNDFNSRDVVQREVATDVLIAEVTEEQYKVIKSEVIKAF